ncbi:hypothetical protein NMG60_11004917 [Bertholletia excelsa]
MVKTGIKKEKGHPVRPIENKRARKICYMKRKECIKKKTEELAVLCGINACSICFGPDGEIDTWPENPAEVKAVIGMYRQCGNKQNKKIQKFFAGLGERVEEQGDAAEKSGPKKASFGWDDAWLHGLSTEFLNNFLKAVESKMEAVTFRIEQLKDKQKQEENVDAVWLDNPLSVYDFDPSGLFQITVCGSEYTNDPMVAFDVPISSTTPVCSMDYDYYGDTTSCSWWKDLESDMEELTAIGLLQTDEEPKEEELGANSGKNIQIASGICLKSQAVGSENFSLGDDFDPCGHFQATAAASELHCDPTATFEAPLCSKTPAWPLNYYSSGDMGGCSWW